MTGTYRKISVFTPFLDVKVVQPVKFRAKYAITAGMMRSAAAAPAASAQPGRVGFVPKDSAKGMAIMSPSISPLVEKSSCCEGK